MKPVIFTNALILFVLTTYVNARSKLGPLVTDKVGDFLVLLFYSVRYSRRKCAQ